ncbi:MAG TPA: methionyl-tRNA formyltransferase [Gammaproteobacteria bacterium]|nr:methionyl-tRNA formyltransferase [Gammaproteobacteria bacterium]
MKHNIIFAGTPQFAVSILNALIHAGHSIKAVYTQPDRPAGRGRKLTPSPVKELALEQKIPIFQPISLRDEREQQILASLNADVMIVVAYGLLLPEAVLQAPKYGCINVHASLLPRFRGAAPIQRAILAGDETTGVTIMQMDKGLDTGDMLNKLECRIRSDDTSAVLHDQLAALGAKALLKTLDHLDAIVSEKQNNHLATYAHKISKEEAEIDWKISTEEIDRKIRAFNPWPVAFTHNAEHLVRIWKAEMLAQPVFSEPGKIVQLSRQGIDVATGNGILRLLQIQLSGGKILSAADVFNSKAHIFGVGNILT